MPTPTNLDQLAAEYLSNSARWFPDLHHDDTRAAVHFALGLAGEVGELVELMAFVEPGELLDHRTGEELADVTIYALDLAAVLSIDLDLVWRQHELQATGLWPDLVVAAGLVCNVTKKLNRGDDVAPELLGEKIGRLVVECFTFAEASSIDLLAAMTAKVAVCEARWGGPRG